MNRTVRSRLALAAATLGGLAVLTGLRADPPQPPPAKPAEQPLATSPFKPVTPKPLSPAVKRGLAYLIAQQHTDGGWGQGGGWRIGGKGGRIEGADVQDPSDVGNTCIAVLALMRAGSTPTAGPYAKNVAKGVDFIFDRIEKADKTSLFVTDVRGTQLQSKIGPYVDTFLASLVLAELKGKAGSQEKRLVACLDKTIGKMVKNQRADGQFAGNEGWAPVLSQGLANKGLARARMAGAKEVSDEVLARAQRQSAAGLGQSAAAPAPASSALALRTAPTGPASRAGGLGGGGFGAARSLGSRGGAMPAAPAGRPGDAGVALYSFGQGVTNLQDVANANRAAEKKAKDVLAKSDTTKEERQKAEATLKRVAETDRAADEARKSVVRQLGRQEFINGFGSNGGEEFLSFLNISESLVVKGGPEWLAWDKKMTTNLERVQDKDGSWSGQHCITGKTFCTGSALLVLMADRAPVPGPGAKPTPLPGDLKK